MHISHCSSTFTWRKKRVFMFIVFW